MTRLSHFFILSLLIFQFNSCHHAASPSLLKGEEAIEVTIHPYGQDLFALDPSNPGSGLDSLLSEYRFFLGENMDSQNVSQIQEFLQDPLNRELAEKCAERFNDVTFLGKGLGSLFYECKSLLPDFSEPAVYTYVSGLLYEMPVQYLDSVMIIGLDMFLGRDYGPYRAAGLPLYMTRRMEKDCILTECARQIAFSMIPKVSDPKTLLDYMIREGIVLYAIDQLLPGTADSLKIGYTSGQMNWCIENEKNLWRLFIDHELFYSTDPQVISKFIQDGPFTAGMPEGAPSMLGKWCGWQIVRSYMKKHDDMSLAQLFNAADSQDILANSGYKPKK